MLCNANEILEWARKNHKAIAAINTPTLETIMAALRAAEDLNTPVIIDHAQSYQDKIDIRIIGPIMLEHARNARVPVCVHLDHGTDWDYIVQAIEMGFTSVMYDCSEMNYEDNVYNLQQMRRYTNDKNVTLEAEIGKMPSSGYSVCTALQGESEGELTDVELAKDFVEKTQVDALAISIGSVHCADRDKVKVHLDIDRLRAIDAVTGDCKMVMHGGSSVDDAQLHEAICNGICKINYYTRIGTAPTTGLRSTINQSEGLIYYHDLAYQARDLMYERCREVLALFNRGLEKL